MESSCTKVGTEKQFDLFFPSISVRSQYEAHVIFNNAYTDCSKKVRLIHMSWKAYQEKNNKLFYSFEF